VERFGLFTIIVLGEVIVGVVGGVAGHVHLSWQVGGTALLGMVVAIGLWWVYFDFISGRPPYTRTATSLGWIYLHLPVAVGIAAAGASMLNVIEHTDEPLPGEVRWLMVGAVALVLASIALIMRILDFPESYHRFYQDGSRVMLVSGALVAGLGLTTLDSIPLLLALSLLLLLPVAYGILIWIKVFDAQDLQS
jgi:low temperature requirement protein LtrA